MELSKNNDVFNQVIDEVKIKFINGKLSEKMEGLIKEFNEERYKLENLLKKDGVTKGELEEATNNIDVLENKIIAQNKYEIAKETIKELRKLEK